MATRRCDEHGLTYDPAVHTGCVLCRGRQRMPAPKRRSWFLPGLTLVVCATSLVSMQVARMRNRSELQRLAQSYGSPAAASTEIPLPKGAQPIQQALQQFDNRLLVGTWLYAGGAAPLLGSRVDLFPDGGMRVRQELRTVEGRFDLVARDRMAVRLVTPGGTTVDNQVYTFSVTPHGLELHRVGTQLSARFGRLRKG